MWFDAISLSPTCRLHCTLPRDTSLGLGLREVGLREIDLPKRITECNGRRSSRRMIDTRAYDISRPVPSFTRVTIENLSPLLASNKSRVPQLRKSCTINSIS